MRITKNINGLHRQLLFEFDNGLALSVVCGPYTFGGNQGLFEVGLLYKGQLCFTTEKGSRFEFDSVVGYLSMEEVRDFLAYVEKLTPAMITNNRPGFSFP